MEVDQPIRRIVNFSERSFDVSTLPDDMQRVYRYLEEKNGEEEALLAMFLMRTAVELHRAWHMSLLTSNTLQQIKDKFDLKMTWDLGVLKMIFRFEDGAFELHRKVPYDYDSEYQDIYMRIAVALILGHINIHEALIYQTETLEGVHTAKSGLFLRDFPGRLILYPMEAATCAVIFFGGDWADCGVAAICGLAAGMTEYGLSSLGPRGKNLIDVSVGIVTGVIGGIFYEHSDQYCLPSIFLGTLYWFFYGTAFVIGILEIIAGELETGVTRFVAVTVKTFVLSLGACIGLLLVVSGDARDSWLKSSETQCNLIDLNDVWWRVLFYILCSATVLGQYRLPIVHYWRGLIVQYVAYDVQYITNRYFETKHDRDNLDISASNILGAAAAVVTACTVSYLTGRFKRFYNDRILQKQSKRKLKNSRISDCIYGMTVLFIKFFACLRLGRESEILKLDLEHKLAQQKEELEDPTHDRDEILLPEEEENLLIEAIVGSQGINVWSILMPALYQLVPGSIIAKLWFNSIFPPEATVATDNVFSNLMVISTSLALGLIIGFFLVERFSFLFRLMTCDKKKDNDSVQEERREDQKRLGLSTVDIDPEKVTSRSGLCCPRF